MTPEQARRNMIRAGVFLVGPCGIIGAILWYLGIWPLAQSLWFIVATDLLYVPLAFKIRERDLGISPPWRNWGKQKVGDM